MSDKVITVENLSKAYRIGLKEQKHETITGAVFDWIKQPLNNLRRVQNLTRFDLHKESDDTIWALKHVSFDVRRGEVVGIIGRNGAGKSTLLKIFSRITEPTSGRVILNGRVSSLLEVGTGFHRELTGRENIYLNGTILGMRKKEIDAKFDEIVDFSGVEKFLDTPVKRYSSGMQVRLAFSVAAHLEPEILVIDEVLAVGDLEFQKKCLGKMEDVASTGRTVLFVSHNMEAIRTLCDRAILINMGELIMDHISSATIEKYHQLVRELNISQHYSVHDPKHRRGSGQVRFTSVCIMDRESHERFNFKQGEDIHFRLHYEVFQSVPCLYVMIGLRTGRTMEFVTTSKRHAISVGTLHPGSSGTVHLKIIHPRIRPGEYPLYFGLANQNLQAYDVIDNLTNPLTISTDMSPYDAGYDPVKPSGYFDIDSEMQIE